MWVSRPPCSCSLWLFLHVNPDTLHVMMRLLSRVTLLKFDAIDVILCGEAIKFFWIWIWITKVFPNPVRCLFNALCEYKNSFLRSVVYHFSTIRFIFERYSHILAVKYECELGNLTYNFVISKIFTMDKLMNRSFLHDRPWIPWIKNRYLT